MNVTLWCYRCIGWNGSLGGVKYRTPNKKQSITKGKLILKSKIFFAVDGNGSGLLNQQTERSQGENKRDF